MPIPAAQGLNLSSLVVKLDSIQIAATAGASQSAAKP